MTAVYTNKAPGGVAYACSFRITEAVYLVERIVDCLADELEMDPAELRMRNFIQPEQFPYTTKTGWVYDSGEYETAMRLSMEMAGYDELRREQAERRERGELMGIGVAFFTEAVGAGPRKDMDILGLGMADGCELRVHPTGKAVVRLSVQTQGQGHETTFAQIVAEEIGIPPSDIEVVHGDTDNTPFGLGTYGSRSTPVSGAAAALVARKVRDKAQIIASGMLEVSVADLEWDKGSFHVKGDPIEVGDHPGHRHAGARRGRSPEGIEGALEAQICYNPENLTYPFGAYICVVDVDPGTAEVKVRRFVAVDDCGTRINPMIIEGQVHGGPHRRRRHGADGDDRLRRGRKLPGGIAHGLPDPHGARGAGLGDRPHRDPVAAPPDRRQGHRRIGDRRLPTGHRQRGGRRPQALWHPSCRHAPHPLAGLGRHAGAPDPSGVSPFGVAHRMTSRVSELLDGQVPFVHATVVRAQPPTSARPGDDVVVLANGSIEGFVGGHCAEESVRSAALDVLEAGEPLLLRILPPGGEEFPDVRRGPATSSTPACRVARSRSSSSHACRHPGSRSWATPPSPTRWWRWRRRSASSSTR